MKTKLERYFLREMGMRPGEGVSQILTEYTKDDGWRILVNLLRQAARKSSIGKIGRLRLNIALAILPKDKNMEKRK
jgi:hypothetical protein